MSTFGDFMIDKATKLRAENRRLEDLCARAYMRLQCADVPREPWHQEVSQMLGFKAWGVPPALDGWTCKACGKFNERSLQCLNRDCPSFRVTSLDKIGLDTL